MRTAGWWSETGPGPSASPSPAGATQSAQGTNVCSQSVAQHREEEAMVSNPAMSNMIKALQFKRVLADQFCAVAQGLQ